MQEERRVFYLFSDSESEMTNATKSRIHKSTHALKIDAIFCNQSVCMLILAVMRKQVNEWMGWITI